MPSINRLVLFRYLKLSNCHYYGFSEIKDRNVPYVNTIALIMDETNRAVFCDETEVKTFLTYNTVKYKHFVDITLMNINSQHL